MLFRGKSLAVLAAVSVAGIANAQSVSTVTAPAKSIVSDTTAAADLRIYGKQSAGEGTYDKSQELRLKVSSNFLNKNVSGFVTLGAIHGNNSSAVSQRRPEIELQVNTLSSTYASLLPFTNIRTPFQGSGTDAQLGLRPQFTTTPIQTVVGSVEGFAEIEAYALLSSRPRQAEVTNADDQAVEKFGLSKSADNKVTKTESDYSTVSEYRAGIRFVPAILSNNLNIELSSMFGQDRPRVATIVDNETIEEKNALVEYSDAKAVIGYKVNDSFSVRNETAVKSGGYYGSQWDGNGSDPRFSNLTGITYTIF